MGACVDGVSYGPAYYGSGLGVHSRGTHLGSHFGAPSHQRHHSPHTSIGHHHGGIAHHHGGIASQGARHHGGPRGGHHGHRR
jgi:hypothetical protein